jgi:hypothetical protein
MSVEPAMAVVRFTKLRVSQSPSLGVPPAHTEFANAWGMGVGIGVEPLSHPVTARATSAVKIITLTRNNFFIIVPPKKLNFPTPERGNEKTTNKQCKAFKPYKAPSWRFFKVCNRA